jgi:Family of unknown function (DUF6361)
MTSVLAWLAHDEAERRRMQEAIELFAEHDTLDELGIGSVRDAFSDLLFPGTSVLHTRARYLLFIPWIYIRIEDERVRAAKVGARAHRDEIKLIYALLAGGERAGVIGERARDDLKLLPSEAYWTALARLGFRLFGGTRAQYHRSLDGYQALRRSTPRAEDDEPLPGVHANWHPTLDDLRLENATDGDFLAETTFRLTAAEAEYIRERVRTRARDSLFAFLIARDIPTAVGAPWLHPDLPLADVAIQRQVERSRVFSEMMHGAALLYNFMLAQRRRDRELSDDYGHRLARWGSGATALQLPDWDEFWQIALSGNPRITPTTQRFVQTWFELATSLGDAVAHDERARSLIERRERQTKKRQARLANPRRLEIWSGATGLRQLTYRWDVVQAVINDVLEGVRRGGDA